MTDIEPQKPDSPAKAWLLSRFCLYLGAIVFVLAVAMNAGFYLNGDIFSVDAIGPHPTIGEIAEFLLLGMMLMPIILLYNFFPLILSPFKKPRGHNFVVALIGFLLTLIAHMLYTEGFERVRTSPNHRHTQNLRDITFTLKSYAGKYSRQLPSIANWCDDLAAFEPYIILRLKNRGRDTAEVFSHYGINKNLEGKKLMDLPVDTVLLFETEPARNPAGGPELMSTKNHNGKGCFVMFANGQIKFVRPEDFNNLRWKP